MTALKEKFRKSLLEEFSDQGLPTQKARKLARMMGIRESDYADFRRAFKEVSRLLASSEAPRRSGTSLVGVFTGHPRGFGFIAPREGAGSKERGAALHKVLLF